MNDCVILYRTKGGVVDIVRNPDETDLPSVFPHMDAAIEYADSNKLFESGQADYQIVELDEL